MKTLEFINVIDKLIEDSYYTDDFGDADFTNEILMCAIEQCWLIIGDGVSSCVKLWASAADTFYCEEDIT